MANYSYQTAFLSFVFTIFLGSALICQDLPQSQTDSYTRYELLEPVTQSFKIIYDVSATAAGKKVYFNTLRKGSEHIVSEVIDRMTGMPLKWKIVDGAYAKLHGHPRANPDAEYLMVNLARAVPENGEARIRIDKTYKDAKSYYKENEMIIFERTLGIKRNSVVLPYGYEIVSCNYPSQVEMEADGRLKLSFFNRGNQAVNYKITAQKLDPSALEAFDTNDPHPWPGYVSKPQGRDKSMARLNFTINERAFQDREIVYFLQQPETNSFRLYHDYTESRPGRDKYLNIVRPGSKATNPFAYILDTGEKLNVETLKGHEITSNGIDLGSEPDENTEVVVIWYPPIQEGHSVRLRIEETYTDPNRYVLYNNELIWDRSFGRNRNTVILPSGWWLTTNSIPAIIDTTEEGQVRLHYINDRPDNIDVFIKARRKSD